MKNINIALNNALKTQSAGANNDIPCYVKIKSGPDSGKFICDKQGSKLEFKCNEAMIAMELPGKYSFVNIEAGGRL